MVTGIGSKSECGPGCDCNKPAAGNKTKIVVGLVVALIA